MKPASRIQTAFRFTNSFMIASFLLGCMGVRAHACFMSYRDLLPNEQQVPTNSDDEPDEPPGENSARREERNRKDEAVRHKTLSVPKCSTTSLFSRARTGVRDMRVC